MLQVWLGYSILSKACTRFPINMTLHSVSTIALKQIASSTNTIYVYCLNPENELCSFSHALFLHYPFHINLECFMFFQLHSVFVHFVLTLVIEAMEYVRI